MLKWFKVLFFTLLLILSSYFFVLNTKQILDNPTLLLSLSLQSYLPFLLLILSIYLLSISFAMLTTLSPGIYTKVGAYLLSASVPVVLQPSLEKGLLGGLFLLLIFLFGTWEIRNQINAYFHFTPRVVYSSSLRLLTTLLVIFVSLGYFISYHSLIKQEGFKIPSDLVNQVTSLTVNNLVGKLGGSRQDLGVESKELEKLGLTKGDLEKLLKGGTKQDTTKQISESLGAELEKNIQSTINPYIDYIPYVIAGIFFLTLHSLAGFGFFLVPMFLSVAFFILEKTRVVHFEEHSQVVKRLVLDEEPARILSEKEVSDSELKSQVKEP